VASIGLCIIDNICSTPVSDIKCLHGILSIEVRLPIRKLFLYENMFETVLKNSRTETMDNSDVFFS